MSNLVVTALALLLANVANAQTCPSDAVKAFAGKWQGQAVLMPANAPQQQSATQAEYYVIDCDSFGATFNYLDGDGKVVRSINFTASADPENVGLFTISNGTTTDKSGSTAITGSFRKIQDGTLLGTFVGAIESKPVYMTELMNVAESQDGIKQLVRNVQMFSDGKGGAYKASRVDFEQHIN